MAYEVWVNAVSKSSSLAKTIPKLPAFLFKLIHKAFFLSTLTLIISKANFHDRKLLLEPIR